MNNTLNVDNKKIILSTIPKEPLKRNENIKEEDISYIQQVNLLNQLYMNCEDMNCEDVNNGIRNVIVRELDRKLSGYKQQDIKKEIYDEKQFITYDDILEMLVGSKIKCFYCRSMMKIIYKVVRDNQQWTLDRIDNDYGHTKENTIICCLKCNLQRRCINKDKFEFTKKMSMCKIKKMDH